MPRGLTMEAPIFNVHFRSRRLRSLLIAFGLLAVSMGALAVSLYCWTRFQWVPPINWFLAVLGSLATLGLAVALANAHSPFRTALPAVALGVTCVGVGFVWGPLGIVCLIVAGGVAAELISWLRRHARKL